LQPEIDIFRGADETQPFTAAPPTTR
jgi:hypothetical protein